MYRQAYAETSGDSSGAARSAERTAFEDVASLLDDADASPAGSPLRLMAAAALSDLWSKLLENLSDDANALPEDLKDDLRSVGLHMMKRAAEIAEGEAGPLADLADANREIAAGLA